MQVAAGSGTMSPPSIGRSASLADLYVYARERSSSAYMFSAVGGFLLCRDFDGLGRGARGRVLVIVLEMAWNSGLRTQLGEIWSFD
jgi:hypothetical protein